MHATFPAMRQGKAPYLVFEQPLPSPNQRANHFIFSYTIHENLISAHITNTSVRSAKYARSLRSYDSDERNPCHLSPPSSSSITTVDKKPKDKTHLIDDSSVLSSPPIARMERGLQL